MFNIYWVAFFVAVASVDAGMLQCYCKNAMNCREMQVVDNCVVSVFKGSGGFWIKYWSRVG